MVGRVTVVRVVGEGLGVGMGVEEVRTPIQQHRLVFAGAVTGDHLAASAGQQVELDTGLGHRCLHGLRHVHETRTVDQIHVDFQTGDSGPGQDALGALGVELERRGRKRAGEPHRQESLVHTQLAAQQLFGDALVIDQVTHGFPDRRVAQFFGLLVQADEMHRGLGEFFHPHVRARAHGGDLVRAKVARDVRVTRFNQQALCSRLGHVLQQDGVELGCVGTLPVGFEQHHLLGFEQLEQERAASSRVAIEPAVAKVAVLLLAHHDFFVDDVARARAEHVEHITRTEIAAPTDRHGTAGSLGNHLRDVVVGPAELGQNEGGCLVELDDTPEREQHVFEAHRITTGKAGIATQGELDGLAVRRGLPGRGYAGQQLGRITRVVLHQAFVDVGYHLAAAELEGLGRIEAHNIFDVLGDHECVPGRGGPCAKGDKSAQ